MSKEAPNPVAADAPDSFEPEGRDLRIHDLFDLRQVETPQVSPDGRHLVFVLREMDREANGYRTSLHLYDIDRDIHRPLTGGAQRDAGPRFSPCGRRICFTSDRGGKPQVYVMELDGGEAFALTEMELGASAPTWSPDGRLIAFVAAVDASKSMPHTPDGVERAHDGQAASKGAGDAEQAGSGKEGGAEARVSDRPGGSDEKADAEDPRVIEHLPYRSGTNYLGAKRRHLHLVRVPSPEERGRALVEPAAGVRLAKPVRITGGDALFDGPRFGPEGEWLYAWAMRRWEENDLHGAGEAVRLALVQPIRDLLQDRRPGRDLDPGERNGEGEVGGKGARAASVLDASQAAGLDAAADGTDTIRTEADGTREESAEDSSQPGSDEPGVYEAVGESPAAPPFVRAPLERLNPDDHRPGAPQPSPCGRYVAWTNTPRDMTFSIGSHLVVARAPRTDLPSEAAEVGVDLAAAPFEPLANTLDFDRVIERFQWLESGDRLLVECPDRGSRRPFVFDLEAAMAAGAPRQGLPPLDPATPGDRAPETEFVAGVKGFEDPKSFATFVHAAEGTLAAARATPEGPAELVIGRLDGTSAPRTVTAVNAALLAEREPRPIVEHWFEAPDGKRIHGWLIRPRPERDRGSLVLEIHGGPHSMWGPGEPTMWLEYQCLASAGHSVFFSNPRGSNGYGRDYRMAIHKNWGFAEEQDFLSGVTLALAETGADPGRVGVTGGSYGGYMTAWLCGRHAAFKAAVSQRGVYDLVAFTGATDIPKFTEAIFETTVGADAATLWRHSPLAYAEGIDIPFLILHAEQDYRAPIVGAEQLFALLKRKGRKTVFVRYPREGHELSRSGEPEHRIDRLKRILGWFETYL